MSNTEIKKIERIIHITIIICTSLICLYIVNMNSSNLSNTQRKLLLFFIILFWFLAALNSLLFYHKKLQLNRIIIVLIGFIPVLIDLLIKETILSLPLMFIIALLYISLHFPFLKGYIYILCALPIYFITEWIHQGNLPKVLDFTKYQLLNQYNYSIYILGILLIFSLTYFRNILYEKIEDFEKQRLVTSEIASTNIKLQDYANKIKDISEAEERSRLRRDIHDILAHSLTSMVVQIGACEKLIYDEPAFVEQELKVVRETIRESLLEVRTTLRELQIPKANIRNGRNSWIELIETFTKVTGITIKYTIDDNFDILNEELNEIIYRILQESLTNSYRHGHAQKVDIVIKWDKDFLHIRVSDNGDGVASMKEGLGYTGMKERLNRINGKLAWESEVGLGFNLGIDIPVKGGRYSG